MGVLLFPVTIERTGSDVIYFTSLEANGPPAWLALPIIFAMVAIVLAGPAEVVGRCFGKLPPLTAYRYDLIGSLLGICAFTALSFLHAPSVVWGSSRSISLSGVDHPVPPARDLRMGADAGRQAAAGDAGSRRKLVSLLQGRAPRIDVPTKPDMLVIGVNGVPHQLMAPAKWKLEQGEANLRDALSSAARRIPSMTF